MTEAHGPAGPDATETDPAALSASEDLDEDRLRVDPLEEGVEPPERYAFSDRFGTTAREAAEGESIGDRLRQEEPDVRPDEVPHHPVAETAVEELDETIDDQPADEVGEPGQDGSPYERRHVRSASSAYEENQNADAAGGSVAETIRTPPDE